MNTLLSKQVTGDKIPILCNQENFIMRENSYKIRQAFPSDIQVVINPAIKKDLDLGRPSNGMFIAYPDNIKDKVTDVSPGYWRLQAVKIKLSNSTILLINSYFPTDSRRNNIADTDLLETLSNVKKIIDMNPSDSILWAGDINSDFSRNSYHTTTVQEALEELGLKSWDNFHADFTCTHDMQGQTFTSLLDHFFWNSVFSDSVLVAGVLHLSGNLSDHSPIFCSFDSSIVKDLTTDPTRLEPRPSWKRADEDQKHNYKMLLEAKLSQLTIPYSVSNCRDVHCKQHSHRIRVVKTMVPLYLWYLGRFQNCRKIMQIC